MECRYELLEIKENPGRSRCLARDSYTQTSVAYPRSGAGGGGGGGGGGTGQASVARITEPSGQV